MSIDTALALAEEATQESHANRALGNIFAEYDFLKNLTARVSVGGDVTTIRENAYFPRTTNLGHGIGGDARVGSVEDITWLNENTLTYDATLSDRHDLEVLAGLTAQGNRIASTNARATGFSSDRLGSNNLSAASEPRAPSSSASDWGLLSYITRANYTLDNKYLLTATARYDGSSRFGEGNKWGFFPSGAVGWRLSEEAFLQNVEALSNLKLRASYGVTGNQAIGQYQSLAQLGPVSYVLGGGLVSGFVPTGIANPNLKWETTTQLDLGLDLGFFGNRLAVTADYYRKETDNLLLLVPLPQTSGYSSSLNVGRVENRGVEMGIESYNLTGDVSWNTRFNVAINRNEVLDLGERSQITDFVTGSGNLKIYPHRWIVGEPLNTFYGLETNGLWQQDEAQEAAEYEAEPGNRKYVDQNGDGQITPEDKVVIGSAEPDFTGGLTNRFSYKGIQLSVFMQFSVGGEVYNLTRLPVIYNSVPVSARWSPDNPQAEWPSIASNQPNQASDAYLEDSSFLRFRDITLAYDLPTERVSWLQSAGFRRARISLSAKNAFTITGYSGYDPEVSQQGQAALGVDNSVYPTARSLRLGLDVTF